MVEYTLPKAQKAQGTESFDLFNTFSSKQKLQQLQHGLVWQGARNIQKNFDKSTLFQRPTDSNPRCVPQKLLEIKKPTIPQP